MPTTTPSLASLSEGPAGATLASVLAGKIRSAITSGTILPGTKLRLDELRESYGVSLSPLREALSRLGAEGFVVMEDQRGYRVAPVSEANFREVLRLRLELETLALKEAIAHGDDEWEGRLVAALHRLNKVQRLSGGQQGVDEWNQLHQSFHSTLIGACNMPLLLSFCGILHDLNDRYRHLFLANNPIDRDVAKEHEKIVDAALVRDSDTACKLLAKHIQRNGDNVLQVVTKHLSKAK